MPPLGHRRADAATGRPLYAKLALWERLDAYAKSQLMSRSQVFVLAMTEYLDRVAPPVVPVPPRDGAGGAR